MTRPDLNMVRQTQEPVCGPEEVLGTTSREVAACSAYICMEYGIATENIVWEN